ncbi:MAG: response regulator [Candidatus Omnitrophica bacterium]|nr:response regulator [Candidatus Omnitrophota bacterium]MCA9431913.1 response regulator [Candidatus Omnitrophota bacterium]MCA9443182.1 response regulator [Candidatus Omnitrophota bacterium]MCB9781384.1 response regulator [Candidatus Omnitrophota bacterium]
MNENGELNILIVEDSEDDRDLLTEIMKRVHTPIARVEAHPDGGSALKAMESQPFDLIFLDYHLPDMNGMEVMPKAKEIQPDTEVVMITSQGNEELAVSAMKGGAFDYWVKGKFTKDALERTFNTLKTRLSLKQKIKTQQENLIIAERQRVMLESIGATCHHFSQPVTSLMGRLEILISRNPPLDDRDKELLRDCLKLSRRMGDLVQQFQNVREYRTVPYVEDYDILDIEGRPEKG